ncbi:MAG: hypothetical protein OXR66_01495 [Candidatus Woesearchaeota archaeon]|nr:hypothetical protein [Candidatus Woesearchaeota archaeon]
MRNYKGVMTKYVLPTLAAGIMATHYIGDAVLRTYVVADQMNHHHSHEHPHTTGSSAWYKLVGSIDDFFHSPAGDVVVWGSFFGMLATFGAHRREDRKKRLEINGQQLVISGQQTEITGLRKQVSHLEQRLNQYEG